MYPSINRCKFLFDGASSELGFLPIEVPFLRARYKAQGLRIVLQSKIQIIQTIRKPTLPSSLVLQTEREVLFLIVAEFVAQTVRLVTKSLVLNLTKVVNTIKLTWSPEEGGE